MDDQTTGPTFFIFISSHHWLPLVTASPPHSSRTHPTTSGSRDAQSSAPRRRPQHPELMATPARAELLSLSRARGQGAGARRRTGCGSLWSSCGAGAASPRPCPHLRVTRGGAPCGWEWEPPAARPAAPRGQSAQVCARQPPYGARRRQPSHGARRWSRLHSSRSSARAHRRRGAPLPHGQEEELRAAVMVANRQGFKAVASVCCMCWGCF
jgi:hypothetical protein